MFTQFLTHPTLVKDLDPLLPNMEFEQESPFCKRPRKEVINDVILIRQHQRQELEDHLSYKEEDRMSRNEASKNVHSKLGSHSDRPSHLRSRAKFTLTSIIMKVFVMDRAHA
ncbi:hypothetical protein PS2_037555 [Malus domestica]